MLTRLATILLLLTALPTMAKPGGKGVDDGLATHRQALVVALRKAYGSQANVALDGDRLTITSPADFTWYFIPPSSDGPGDAFQEALVLNFRLDRHVDADQHQALKDARETARHQAEADLATAEADGMPRDAKSGLEPRNATEKAIVDAYYAAVRDRVTVPVYHGHGLAVYYAANLGFRESCLLPADEKTQARIAAFYRRLHQVLTPYEKPTDWTPDRPPVR